MSITIEPVSGALGAVLPDVDLRDPDLDFAEVRAALLEHEVVFFPKAHLSEDEQLTVGRRLGTPSIYPIAAILGATEPTLTVIEDGPDSPNVADEWHTDVPWSSTPPAFALLHMEAAPEVGGDTLWASATKAYETLSEPMQQLLAGLTVAYNHDGFSQRVAEKAGDAADAIIEALRRDYPPVEHPLIRTHPETHKRSLMFSPHFTDRIVGLKPLESRTVMSFIGEHVKDAALQCRWRWSDGDLAIWDERSSLHRAAADHHPQRRVIRRLEVDGDTPYFDPAV